jgi:AraC-like DNA-binding protein
MHFGKPTPKRDSMSLEAKPSIGCTKVGEPGVHISDQRIRNVLQAIELDPSHDIQELALMVNLSISRLSHLFKTVTGCSLQSYLSNSRLERAAELLQSTEMRVKEISYGSGYRHAASFVRAFRNKFGSSPNSYRGQ